MFCTAFPRSQSISILFLLLLLIWSVSRDMLSTSETHKKDKLWRLVDNNDLCFFIILAFCFLCFHGKTNDDLA